MRGAAATSAFVSTIPRSPARATSYGISYRSFADRCRGGRRRSDYGGVTSTACCADSNGVPERDFRPPARQERAAREPQGAEDDEAIGVHRALRLFQK